MRMEGSRRLALRAFLAALRRGFLILLEEGEELAGRGGEKGKLG